MTSYKKNINIFKEKVCVQEQERKLENCLNSAKELN